MDASKLTQMRSQAANRYRSNWQPRDASEVTLRHAQMSQKNNSSVHQGPVASCCTGGALPVNRSVSPTAGFSTTYSSEIVFNKVAGCVQCNDPNFGAPGGVELITESECVTISTAPLNPVKGQPKCCADPGIKQRPGIVPAAQMLPSYTGWRDQVPAPTAGTLPQRQVPPYPSG